MDVTESVNSYILLVEHLGSDGGTLEELLQETFPASNFDADWTVVVNIQLDEEQEVEDVPTTGKTATIRPSQAFVFLGEDHAGIIGPGAGEFYDERFNLEDGYLKNELMNDFTSEVI